MNNLPDDLVILCIGSLYSGPWSKKYWSASRGKDRYPYPVGYLASRCRYGSNCQMTIDEGCNGPEFTITSSDGRSCSGSTPDIALKNFQKRFLFPKSCSGKITSNESDGIEFFGFKNIIVRRLLRELVSNHNEHNSLSPSCSNETLFETLDTKCPQSRSQPDILSHFPRSEVQNSRSPQHQRSFNLNCSENKSNTLGTYFEFDENSRKNECGAQSSLSSLVQSEKESLTTYKEYVSNLPEQEQLVKSQGNGMDAEDKNNDAFKSKELDVLMGISQYASDTFQQDPSPDSNKGLDSGIPLSNWNNKVNQATESPSGLRYNSYAHLGKFDLDSSNREIARSMMAVLLPQAVPLLINSCREDGLIENLHAFPNKEQGNMDYPIDFQALEAECSIVPDSEDVKLAINPSSTDKFFDHDQGGISGDGHSDRQDTQTDIRPLEPNEFKDILCVDEVNVVLRERSDPVPAIPSVIKLEENDLKSDMCTDGRESVENSLPSSRQKMGPEAVSDCLVHFKVYSRRKRKGDASLRDSVPEFKICHNLGSTSKQELRRTLEESNVTWDGSSVVDIHESKINNLKCLGVEHFTDSWDKNLCVDKEVIKQAYPSLKDEELEFHTNNTLSLEMTELGSHAACEQNAGHCCTFEADYLEQRTDLRASLRKETDQNVNSCYDLVGCYYHPLKISSLLLRTNGKTVVVCAICASSDNLRTMFLYRLTSETSRIGAPCLIGHSNLTYPSLENMMIVPERSSFQFTPDGRYLVMHGSIIASCCREGKTDCMCQTREYSYSDNTSVKIVHVNSGYVTYLAKLRAGYSILCMLIMEPDLLIVSGEGGSLHVFKMNLSWSSVTEEFSLTKHETCTSTVDLKKIPSCSSLVLGHNCIGEFLLWDITERTLVSRFSATNASIANFFPVSAFNWPVSQSFNVTVEDSIHWIMDATRLSLSNRSKDDSLGLEWKDPAVWLLISTNSSSDVQSEHKSSSSLQQQWRLGLLAKSTMMLGRVADPTAVTMGFSAGNGITGTQDGHVYVWDLLSGAKLGFLHGFKGGRVGCIATDCSTVGVTDCSGQLLVYRCPSLFIDEIDC